MAEPVRNLSIDTEDTRIRGALILLFGSGPLLFLFLDSPEMSDPYYVFGLGATVLAVIAGAALFVSSQTNGQRLRRRR